MADKAGLRVIGFFMFAVTAAVMAIGSVVVSSNVNAALSPELGYQVTANTGSR